MACTLDFRFLDEGLGGEKGKKRKRDAAAADEPESMDLDDDESNPSKIAAVASSDANKPSFGKPSYDGVIAGRVSGRKWKQVRTRRASAKAVSLKPKDYEARAKEKEIKKAYRERMDEMKEEIRRNKVEKRRVREEREKKKKENILRSGTQFQVISNPKTLKKIAKSKDKKKLKMVPDELVMRGKKNKKIDVPGLV